jgi:chemotaxis response regulator CheB
MPGAVAKANLADRQLPLKEVASEIVTRLKVGRPTYHGVSKKV